MRLSGFSLVDDRPKISIAFTGYVPGIWISAVSDVRMRAVAHLDVSRDDVTKAADKLAESLVAELAGLVQGFVQAVTARTIR